MSINLLFSKNCWQRPAMFCLYTSSKVSRPWFEFSLKVEVMGSNPGYLLKYFLPYLVPDEVAAWSFGSTSPIVDVTAAVWVFNELKTRRYCFKFRQRYESIFLVAASSLTQAILTVAFHRKLESEPFFTAKTSCLPFVSKKWLEISFNSVMEDKNPSYEILDTCCNERVWRNTSPCKKKHYLLVVDYIRFLPKI